MKKKKLQFENLNAGQIPERTISGKMKKIESNIFQIYIFKNKIIFIFSLEALAGENQTKDKFWGWE